MFLINALLVFSSLVFVDELWRPFFVIDGPPLSFLVSVDVGNVFCLRLPRSLMIDRSEDDLLILLKWFDESSL